MSSIVKQIDKHGRDYDYLLELQATELEQWKKVLQPAVYAVLHNTCKVENRPAEHTRQLHTVMVGCELHHWVMGYDEVLYG